MVGDNWVADIEGAKNAGIDQAFLSKKVSPNNSFIPTYQITSLMDLIDAIR
ncbi:HAD hydrolase-like protein [Bacteroides sp.]|uniref:HAD hydrolase-like protein n=1 Tax=Bacteroides sp. TaxID=29523 RepID=UPI00258C1553|nr:HAD hydrolase-like protein [Bacteroides sp.]